MHELAGLAVSAAPGLPLERPRVLRRDPGRPFILFAPMAFFRQARLPLQFAAQRANHDVQRRGRRRTGGRGEARQ